ncbi:flagellar M-ring protein FliF [Mangrovicoccus ximenensis]|uniref:flagellar M-ring protein FliF n=1 Tax=Mangrovicoccus ximenensis TaxID=1911570 RepID=UPI0011AE5204|nr:flagellar M-ring protein FliF C-terminal domain-containing protein [Mangrovicoccus ximenensis]
MKEERLFDGWGRIINFRLLSSIGIILAISAILYSMLHLLFSPRMTPLYSSLTAAEIRDVIVELDDWGIKYDFKDGTVYVPSREIENILMSLDSTPGRLPQGYEILDSINGFGTTSQMFDAAFLRAREGELSRTITSNQNIVWARVHLSFQDNPSWGPKDRGAASVLVYPNGPSVNNDQAQAIKNLVASSMAGLDKKNVTVVNAKTGIIADDTTNDLMNSISDTSELKLRAERILDAYLGFGKSRVEISIESERQVEQLVERKVDPAQKVEISSETREVANSSEDTDNGGVTVSSNLPSGNGVGENQIISTKSENENIERKNYEFSEVRREVEKQPGGIKRMSVAVLVDGVWEENDIGTTTWRARTDTEISDLEALVASALGVNEERGDQLTIRSMQFAISPYASESSNAVHGGFLRNSIFTHFKTAVFAVTTTLLAFFVLKPAILDRGIYSLGAKPSESIFENNMEQNGRGDGLMDVADNLGLPKISDGISDGESMPKFETFDFANEELNISPVGKLVETIESRKEDAMEILRDWLDTDRFVSG